jgi:hypothetical protein
MIQDPTIAHRTLAWDTRDAFISTGDAAYVADTGIFQIRDAVSSAMGQIIKF